MNALNEHCVFLKEDGIHLFVFAIFVINDLVCSLYCLKLQFIKFYNLKLFIGSISSNCSDSSSRGDENEVGARKFSEAVVQTLSSVASVLEYPKS